MNQAPTTATLPAPKGTTVTQKPWLWNVVLLDDDDHTVEYVIDMLNRVFGHNAQDGLAIAKRVDRDGRAVCFTTHREHAELKQEMIHGFGRDVRAQGCAGSMSSILEPAEPASRD
jgi:ATP-dependent Clp protease adaptor protein ClpS